MICPLSWAPGRACDLHVRASPSRVIHTSLSGVLTASAALLVPITYIPPSPRQPIRGLSPRRSLLGESHPVPYPVDTCSPARSAPVSTTQGYSVPHLRLALNVGPHSSPGFSGVSLSRLQTRSARSRAILAVAPNPRRLLPPNDDSTMGSTAACPYSAVLGGIPGRIPSDRRLLPLLGLRVSRYPGEYAVSPTPRRQEWHLHGDTVIKDPLILAPYPLPSDDRSFRETDRTLQAVVRLYLLWEWYLQLRLALPLGASPLLAGGPVQRLQVYVDLAPSSGVSPH